MKIAYLECFAGIAGDMLLGALVDAGVDAKTLQDAADSLGLGVRLDFSKVDRSGIQATKARVLVHGVDAESAGGSGAHAHAQKHEHAHTHTHADEHGVTHTHTQTHTHEGEHDHAHAHSHTHDGHEHGRSLADIRALIQAAAITANAKGIALSAFEKLGAAEAKIHGVPIDQVHFHEVGAVDAIIDIVCGAVGADSLGVDAWYCSAVNTGSGFVDCAHGRFPVPAPATLELLSDVPVYAEGPAKELTTPTGAALIGGLSCRFNALPASVFSRSGYGAGTRNPERFPNVLRLRIGVTAPSVTADRSSISEKDTVIVLECAVDDATPETLAFAAHMLIEHGALDVMQQPAFMKKGRQGTLFTVVCRPEDARPLEHLIFRETTTLGIRTREEKRSILERHVVSVETEYGLIGMKLGMRDAVVVNLSPEFEDCRKAAERYSVPVKQVMQASVAAYLAEKPLSQGATH
jgi:uncharacterized protein (TIGR00299 family) protein